MLAFSSKWLFIINLLLSFTAFNLNADETIQLEKPVVEVEAPVEAIPPENKSVIPDKIRFKNGFVYQIPSFEDAIAILERETIKKINILLQKGKLTDASLMQEDLKKYLSTVSQFSTEDVERFQKRRYGMLIDITKIFFSKIKEDSITIVDGSRITRISSKSSPETDLARDMVTNQELSELNARELKRLRQQRFIQSIDIAIVQGAPIVAFYNEVGVSIAASATGGAMVATVGATEGRATGFSIGHRTDPKTGKSKTILETYNQKNKGLFAGLAGLASGSLTMGVYLATNATAEQHGPHRARGRGVSIPTPIVIPLVGGIGASVAVYGDRMTISISASAGLGGAFGLLSRNERNYTNRFELFTVTSNMFNRYLVQPVVNTGKAVGSVLVPVSKMIESFQKTKGRIKPSCETNFDDTN